MDNQSPTDLFTYPDLSTLDTSALTLDVLPASSLPVASKEEIDAMMNSHIELGEISTITLTKDIFAVVEQGDNAAPDSTATPKTTSLQPLAEALKMTAGISPQNKEVVTKARVIESGIKDIKKRVDNQKSLTEKLEQAMPSSLTEGLVKAERATQDSMEATALHLQKEGNLTISSNNGIRLSSMEGVNISGSSTFIGTGTVTMNNQVTTIASETIVNMSDTTIARVNGSKFTHIEDSNQLSTRNDITRATETSQTISAKVFSHGAELHSATGETMQATAGSGGHTTHATGGINNFTEAGITNLAKDQITMGAGSAVAPLDSPDPAALRDVQDIAGTIADITSNASFIRMTANGESAGITSVTSGSTSSVSKGSSMSMSSNSYITAASSAVQVAGRQLMNGVTGLLGQSKSHVYHQGKMIISGRFVHGFPSIDTDLIQFPSVPALPPKPSGYSVEDLEKCIPKSEDKKEISKEESALNKDKERSKAKSVLGIDGEAIKKQAGSLTKREGLADTIPGVSGTAQDQANNSSTIADAPSLLGTSINDMSLAVGGAGGPLGIYPDRYSNTSSTPSSSSSLQEVLTEDNLLTLTAKGNKYQELIQDIKNGCPVSKLAPDICALFSTYRSFFLDELHQDSLKLLYREGQENTPIPEPALSLILEFIKTNNSIQYQQVIEKNGLPLIELFIKAYIEDFGVIAATLAAGADNTRDSISAVAKDVTGYLGVGQKALSTIGINVSIPGVGSIGSIVSRGLGLSSTVTNILSRQEGPLNLTDVVALGSEAVEQLGIPIPNSVSSALNNAGSIADYLRSNPNPELIDLIKSTAIQNSVSDLLASGPIEDVLGADYSLAIPAITNLLSQLDSNRPVNRDELVAKLTTVLSSLNINTGGISSLYSKLQPIISIIETGSFNLEDPRIASTIDSFLGGDVASSLLKGYTEVKSIINNVTALSSIPKLLEMMNKQDVPLLAQMSLMLSCLDVFNRLKQIANSVEGIIDDASDLFQSNNESGKVANAISRVKARSTKKKEAKIIVDSPLPPLTIKEELYQDLYSNLTSYSKELPIEIVNEEEVITIPQVLIRNSIDLVTEGTLVIYPSRTTQTLELVTNSTKYYIEAPLIKEIVKEDITIWSNPSPNQLPSLTKPEVTIELPEALPIRDNSFNTGAAYIYESLPYLIQYIRVLEKSSIEDIERLAIVGVPNTVIDELIVVKAVTKLPESNSSCYLIPKLDIEQSEVVVSLVTKGVINFSMKVPTNVTGIGNLLQVCSKTFIRSTNGNPLQVFQDDRQYTPGIFNYQVVSYNSETNQGIARIVGPTNLLLLEDPTGVLYQYSIEDIGDRIIPKIDRVNLLA